MFQARSPFLSGKGKESYHADYLIIANQEIPHCWLKIPFLGEAKTEVGLNITVSLGELSRVWGLLKRKSCSVALVEVFS